MSLAIFPLGRWSNLCSLCTAIRTTSLYVDLSPQRCSTKPTGKTAARSDRNIGATAPLRRTAKARARVDEVPRARRGAKDADVRLAIAVVVARHRHVAG